MVKPNGIYNNYSYLRDNIADRGKLSLKNPSISCCHVKETSGAVAAIEDAGSYVIFESKPFYLCELRRKDADPGYRRVRLYR